MNLVQKIKLEFVSLKIKKGNIEGALKIIRTIEDSSYEKFLYEGICYFEKGNLEEAENLLEKALGIKDDFNCARILCEVYLQRQEFDKAIIVIKPYKNKKEIKFLIKTLQDKNKRESYIAKNNYISIAMDHMRKKEYDLSIRYYLKALEYSGDRAQIFNQIGAIYLNYIKNKKLAEEYFNRAYKIEPNNKTYKMNYAKVKLS